LDFLFFLPQLAYILLIKFLLFFHGIEEKPWKKGILFIFGFIGKEERKREAILKKSPKHSFFSDFSDLYLSNLSKLE